MKTAIVSAVDPLAIQMVLEVLEKGGLVAFPTDTVYGLGALAFNGPAVERIYIAKDRPLEKAIPVLLGDTAELNKVGKSISNAAYALTRRFWPGPLTLVVPKHPDLPMSVSSFETVGVRVPDHQVALKILSVAGPMAVSSANIAGQESPSTAEDVLHQLAGRIPLVVDGGNTPGGVPSTVVDCTNIEPQIIREGPIKKEEILAVLNSDL